MSGGSNALVRAAFVCGVAALCGVVAQAQSAPLERVFPQSKAAIELALKKMQSNLAGRLPVLEGFAVAGEHPLDRYQRGYYQASVEVKANPGGGATVRLSAKVTAWYSDPNNSHSGYDLLKSNGRLEGDLLDQLGEQLASSVGDGARETASKSTPSTQAAAAAESTDQSSMSAPPSNFRNPPHTLSSSSSLHDLATPPPADPTPDQKAENALQAEADSLENVFKNIAHPNNLVAVKKSGTPVVSTPSLTAKPQFLAAAHDEFEMLDFNADWVHIRISGLSRGWIWRNSVEMPVGISDTAEHSAAPLTTAADLFHVSREEMAPFRGDWEPLRNKNVKIISVQKVDEGSKDAGPKERLEYAKSLLDKSYPEISGKLQEIQGVVLIFDSADGGMIAATVPVLQQWKAGTLTDAALWHKCFFDPPETFDSAAASGSK